MQKTFMIQWMSVGFITSLASVTVSAAELTAYHESKPVGVSLEWYQHELDLSVLDIQTSLPGATEAALEAVKGELNTRNKLELLNLRLDYQLTSYLNVYGSVGKLTDRTEVDFSAILPGLSNMQVKNDGEAYTVGARFSAQYQQWLGAVNIAHTRLHQKGNSETIKINSLVPAIGRQTDYGIFSVGLLYQIAEASYSGVINAPLIGETPVTVTTENKDKVQAMMGWQKEVANNFFLDANIGLNGEKQFLLQLNTRF